MLRSCEKGSKEFPFPFTPVNDKMTDLTKEWINAYHACPDGPSKVTYLKQFDFKSLYDVFRRTAIS